MMKISLRHPVLRRFALGCCVLITAGSTFADTVFMPFTSAFSGYAPGGTAPWGSALFEDVSPGSVRLTISASGLVGTENIDQLYFNLNPALSVGNLAFTLQGTIGQFDLPTLSKGTDAFKAGGDGKFDIKLLFSTVGADTRRFTDNESLIYNITGISGLRAADFAYLSLPASDNGPFYSVAHVQRIDGGLSGWVYPSEITYVPEPAALPLLGLGLGCWIFGRRFFARL